MWAAMPWALCLALISMVKGQICEEEIKVEAVCMKEEVLDLPQGWLDLKVTCLIISGATVDLSCMGAH
jgi:hypothetical protein